MLPEKNSSLKEYQDYQKTISTLQKKEALDDMGELRRRTVQKEAEAEYLKELTEELGKRLGDLRVQAKKDSAKKTEEDWPLLREILNFTNTPWTTKMEKEVYEEFSKRKDFEKTWEHAKENYYFIIKGNAVLMTYYGISFIGDLNCWGKQLPPPPPPTKEQIEEFLEECLDYAEEDLANTTVQLDIAEREAQKEGLTDLVERARKLKKRQINLQLLKNAD